VIDNVLITGSHGALARELLSMLGSSAFGLSRQELDIGDRRSVQSQVERLRPALIINCAAATDVDRSELEQDWAFKVNALGPLYLAEAARAAGARLVHMSTDYVFAGDKGAAYVESDPTGPLNFYGLAKLEGETNVLTALPEALVVRTAWIHSAAGNGFPARVIGWAKKYGRVSAPTDQVSSPTNAADLAEGILTLVEKGSVGIIHLAGAGCASRFQLAVETVRAAGLDAEVEPARAVDFVSPAPRPANTCLDCSEAARWGVTLPDWRDGLRRSVAAMMKL
jgi:dTDP-4-dehydrorhamnose reductase